MMNLALLVLGVVALILIWVVVIYNHLIRQKAMLHESESGIFVQQKRRYDLIPNLVNVVSGYSMHEKELLQSIVSLRSMAMQSRGSLEAGVVENNLSGALKTLFAVSENYPDLKANQNFLELQRNLTLIENELQLSRRYYNGVARNYNMAIKTFPSVIIASLFHYESAAYFALDDQAEALPPTIKF